MRAKLPHTEGKIDRDGVNIHYEVYGEGDRTILFLPTWCIVHSRCYKAQIPYFSEHFRCVTFDPRGNGKSDRPSNPAAHSLRNHLDDILAIMDVTGTETAILYGLSYSTVFAAIMAADYPGRVDAAILVGSNSPMTATFDYKTWESWDLGNQPRETWGKYSRDYWRTDYPDFVDFISKEVFIEPHSTKQIEDTIAWSGETNGEILIASMDPGTENDPVLDESTYRRIKCPLLIIHGREDRMAPVPVAEKNRRCNRR